MPYTHKKVCSDCSSIWSFRSDLCPYCGSNDIEDYHEKDCDCKYCEQGYREDIDGDFDYNLEDEVNFD